jgi:ribosomal protein S18 acetylase RimI-like enzyme
MEGRGLIYRIGLLSDSSNISKLDYICFAKDEDEDGETEIHNSIKHSYTTYIVAMSDGSIIGDIGFSSGDSKSTITTLCVHPDFRKGGVAQKLLALAEAYMEASHHASCIKLQVRVQNYGAIHLYEKSGYHIVKILDEYYDSMDGYLMIKTSPSVLLGYITKSSRNCQLNCSDAKCMYKSITYKVDTAKSCIICDKVGKDSSHDIINLAEG